MNPISVRSCPCQRPFRFPYQEYETKASERFSFNPQDEVTTAPTTLNLKGVGTDGSTDKVRLQEKLTRLEGAFVYPSTDSRYHAAAAFSASARAVQTFEQGYGKLPAWATGKSKLVVIPDHDKPQLNAYYSRGDGAVIFHHDLDPVTQKTIYTADSGEVVSHETGHALLDAIRPNYLSSQAREPRAFHESFGDVVALFSSLKDPATVSRMLEQTGGDLTRPNLVAQLHEELGIGISHQNGYNSSGGDYLRTALNNYAWEDPATLPEWGTPDRPGWQPHSFGQVWTGAVYDLFGGLYRDRLNQGLSAREAVEGATDEALRKMARMMKKSPLGDFSFRDMARVLLQVEEAENGGTDSALLRKVLSRRNLLAPGAVLEGVYPLTTRLEGPEFGMFQWAKVTAQISGSPENRVEQERKVKRDLLQLARAGAILWTEPNQQVKTKDLFRPDGTPYQALVTWHEGVMQIEAVTLAT